jgi:hypothetical protein
METSSDYNAAFKQLATEFCRDNSKVDFQRLLPCLETEVQCRISLLKMNEESVIKLLHLPLTINDNNAVYRDNIRLLTV